MIWFYVKIVTIGNVQISIWNWFWTIFSLQRFHVFCNICGFITFRLCFCIVTGTEIFRYSPGFKVKWSVSHLILLLVLSVCMNVLILNWKLHTNKPQQLHLHQNSSLKNVLDRESFSENAFILLQKWEGQWHTIVNVWALKISTSNSIEMVTFLVFSNVLFCEDWNSST